MCCHRQISHLYTGFGLGTPSYVVAVEADDFGSPEPAREADEEQRPVAFALHALAHGGMPETVCESEPWAPLAGMSETWELKTAGRRTS